MKRFLKKVSFFLVFLLVIAVIPSLAVDPFNVFHWQNIRNNGVDPNTNYIKTRVVLRDPQRFDGFLLGSSRVGAIHVEHFPDQKIYNMTYSGGVPREHLATLRTFLEHDVRMETVYMGVDSLSYTEDADDHLTNPLRAPYQVLDNPVSLLEMYVDPALVADSLSTILAGKDTDGYSVIYDYGWWCDYNRPTTMDWSKPWVALGKTFRLEETLENIRAIKTLCDENGIRLVVFTNPMHEFTYRASLEQSYFTFLRELAGITDFVNFSSINDITMNNDNYIDTSHYNADIGDLLIGILAGGEADPALQAQGFGITVTAKNVDSLLELLEKQ